jgi:hypothetical protein
MFRDASVGHIMPAPLRNSHNYLINQFPQSVHRRLQNNINTAGN